MLKAERLGAQFALDFGFYCVFRNVEKERSTRTVLPDCFRCHPLSLCFCGCEMRNHRSVKGRGKHTGSCGKCRKGKCRSFRFVYTRPEEVGDAHLTRRRGFNVHGWRFRCECGHSHLEHNNLYPSCNSCGCTGFRGFGLCLSCDGKYEDHETLFETEEERRMEGRATGTEFIPLAEAPELQGRVFGSGGGEGSDPEGMVERGEITNEEYMELIRTIDSGSMDVGGGVGMEVVRKKGGMRRNDKGAERMVRLMHESSGGTGKGRVVNKYGKFV